MDLSSALAELCASHQVPGAVAAVIYGPAVELAAHGVTSTADPLPATPDTLFMIGSTTKTLTATALLAALQTQGIDLDEPVGSVLPHVPGPPVTFLQLLNHTAGWRGDAAPDTGWGDDALQRGVLEGLREAPQDFAPGAYFSYNNLALAVAGRALEVLNDSTWESSVRALVTEPLAMTETCFLPWEVAGRRTAVGHVLTDEGPQPYVGWPLPRSLGPAGTAISTLHDQVRWARWHLDGGDGPLSDSARLAMQQPTVACRGVLTGVGISWLLQRRHGIDLVTHGGNVSNLQLSSFAMAPSHGFALVVMTNSRGGRELGSALLDRCLLEVLGATPDAAMDALPAAAAYAGRYNAGQWDLVVEVVEEGLSVQVDSVGIPPELRASFVDPPVRARLVGDEQLALEADPTRPVGCFVRNPDGSLFGLEWMLRLSPKAS
jgi:CubicO group peptidase (beta-lactamase class C family)